ncbi:hypothetical protein BDV96DRAFT_13843 [Lophiotrema nucula]|uniref:Uncharacterized protein n=1 Tax=Lophiotrema nucula TaxID=690887 RepID=A0A6A5ZTQ0_9PLEO|nr:hypothetical protein BDV96DRAFT_13843 [Lophiotrema nucula]
MDKLKDAFRNVTTRFQPQQQSIDVNHKISEFDAQSGRLERRLAWPPRLTIQPRILDEVKDVSGRRYPRDIGRSVHLGGHTFYMFGDTFCFNDSDNFVGVTNNAIALIPNLTVPTKSQWFTAEARVPEFVPLSAEEKKFCKDHEARGENKRFVNWAFGGIIERPGSDRKEGWLFYDTVEIHGATPVRQCGIGVAKATVTNADTGELKCERAGKFPLFDPDGPAWGNMSNIAAEDGWTYLLTGRELDNYIARIRTDADFSDPSNYTFLSKDKGWISSYRAPYGPFGELKHDVLHGQGQGAIIFVPEHMPKIGGEESDGKRYTIYPHLWGSNLRKGEVLLSWSDDATMGGKVVAGLFTFAFY